MKHDRAGFEAGYLLAVANIMHLHGEDVVAADVLDEGGIAPNAIRRLGITDFDARPLRRLYRQLKRRELMR